MGTMACVNVPALSLQLLVRNHLEWKGYPVAVLDRDKSYGKILMVNMRARKEGLTPGMRYANALSLVHHLRAGTVSAQEIEKSRRAIMDHLSPFSPCVEPSSHEPGIFWLNTSGLEAVYPSLQRWANQIYSDLRVLGFQVTIVVGFSRFGTYAVGKSLRGVFQFKNKKAELIASRRVPLNTLIEDSRLINILLRLGITTVDHLISLPAEGILRRFGKRAYQLHRFASNHSDIPLQSAPTSSPVVRTKDFVYPVDNVQALIPVFEELLHSSLSGLSKRRERLKILNLSLNLESGEKLSMCIRPTVPTIEKKHILNLMSLRLEKVTLSSGIIEIGLYAEGTSLTQESAELFVEQFSRDLVKANQALDAIRSEFGDHAVARAKLNDSHFPEDRFKWVPLDRIRLPKSRHVIKPCPLVRRILLKPLRLNMSFQRTERIERYQNSSSATGCSKFVIFPVKMKSVRMRAAHHKSDNNCLSELSFPQKNVSPQHSQPIRIQRTLGPYIISGNWWTEAIHRNYYYMELISGELLWVYYDRQQKSWFQQGDII